MTNIAVKTKNTINAVFLSMLATLLFSNPVFAAGGLDEMSNFVEEIQFWIYTLDFLVAGCAISVVGILWYMGRKDQTDFLITLGITAAVGGGIAGVTYMWSIWGTTV